MLMEFPSFLPRFWITNRGFVVLFVQSVCAVMFPILKYSEKHSRNLILIVVFTLCCILCIAGYASTTVNVYMRFLISIINSAL